MNQKLENLTEHQLAEAAHRRSILERLAEMEAEGTGVMKAAPILGVKVATLFRWRKLFGTNQDLLALAPKTANCGRKPRAWLPADQSREAQRLSILTSDNSHESDTAYPLRQIANDPHCPAEVAAVIRDGGQHNQTVTLRRQARVTPEMLMLHRGPNNFNLNSFSQPRSLTYRAADGTIKPLCAGDAFVFDDAHFNQAFLVPCDDESDPCARRFGVRLFRAQHLLGVDLATARCVSSSIVARHNDAYNTHDLLWYFLRFLRSVGKPRTGHFILENNVWKAERLAQALARAGITPWHALRAQGKAIIEERFGQHQKIMAALLPGKNLGRKRGEFEKTNKEWLQIRAGKLDPFKAGYPMVGEFNVKSLEAVAQLNAQLMEGELYQGVPDAKWLAQLAGNKLAKPTAAEAWGLQPEQHKVSLRKGHARCRVEESNTTFYFHAEWFLNLGAGYKVTVCFDPTYAEGGAAILNREVGARAHERGLAEGLQGRSEEYRRPYAPGELIGVAEFVDRDTVPQYSMAEGFDDSASYGPRQKWTKHAHLQFHEIMTPGQSMAAHATEKRDGRGAAERVELVKEQPEEVRHEQRKAPVRRAMTRDEIIAHAGGTRGERELDGDLRKADA